MDESMLMAVASALASGTVAGLTDTGGAALRNLLRLMTNWLGRNSSSRAVLDAARDAPSDEVRLGALARELQSAAADDGLFAAELHRLWQQLQQGLTASNGGVANTVSVSGQVYGPVVQARNVTGGISVGSPVPDGRGHG